MCIQDLRVPQRQHIPGRHTTKFMLDARTQRRHLRDQAFNMEAMQAELAAVRAELQLVVDAQQEAPAPVPVGRPQFKVDPPVFDGGRDAGSLAAAQYITSLNDYFELYNVQEHSKLALIKLSSKDGTPFRTWLEGIRAQLNTYADFETAFAIEFASSLQVAQIHRQTFEKCAQRERDTVGAWLQYIRDLRASCSTATSTLTTHACVIASAPG